MGRLHVWLKTKGITWAAHAPCSPNMTGMVERAIQHIKGKLRVVIKHTDKPARLWDLALETVTLTKNVTLTRTAIDPTRTPWQLFRGTKPNLKHLKVWGCPGYRFIPKEERKDKTFSDRAEPGYHMGVDPECMRTFWFLTKTWKLKRGTTGVFYENLKHMRELPDSGHEEDFITNDMEQNDTLDAHGQPEEPHAPQDICRPIDPRARQFDPNNFPPAPLTPFAAEEEHHIGHRTVLEDSRSQNGPISGQNEPIFEQLEIPAADPEEIKEVSKDDQEHSNIRRSTRSNKGQPSERFVDRDFELEKAIKISQSEPKLRRSCEIEQVLTSKTDPDGTERIQVRFQGDKEPERMKESQLAENTTNMIAETSASLTSADKIFGLMHDVICSTKEETKDTTGQTDIMNCRYHDIMRRPDADDWIEAHHKEIEGMKARNTLKIVKIEPHMVIRDTRWVYAIKGVDATGKRRRRARLVFRGDQQKAGIDYFVSFSGTPNAATVRFSLAICTLLGMRITAKDVSQAYLNGKPTTILHCKIPEGWFDPSFGKNGTDWRSARRDECCEVTGNMYGTKDAASVWGELAADTLTGPLGMTRSQIDGCLFIDKKIINAEATHDHEREPGKCRTSIEFEKMAQAEGELLSMETLYVDDGLAVTAESKEALNKAKARAKHMNKIWGLKMEGSGMHVTSDGREVKRPAHEKDFDGVYSPTEKQIYFKCTHLGVTVVREKHSISMSQEEHLRKVLERLGYGSQSGPAKKSVKNPFPSGWRPTACLDANAVTEERKTEYRSAVAALNYAATQARPDLKLPVSTLAAYFNNPKDEHFTALDYLLRYVKHTIEWRIEFNPKLTEDQRVTGHVDASFADCRDTRRSRTGYFWKLAGGPIIWQSKVQKSMKPARSTAEAELIAATSCLEDGNCLFNLARECGQHPRINKVKITEDNQAVMRIVSNRWTSPRTKALDIRYFWVRAHVLQGKVEFTQVNTEDQAADALTKILTCDERERHFKYIGMEFKTLQESH